MNRLCTRIANVTAKYRPANKGARYTKTKIEQPKQSNFVGINWKAESIKITRTQFDAALETTPHKGTRDWRHARICIINK